MVNFSLSTLIYVIIAAYWSNVLRILARHHYIVLNPVTLISSTVIIRLVSWWCMYQYWTIVNLLLSMYYICADLRLFNPHNNTLLIYLCILSIIISFGTVWYHLVSSFIILCGWLPKSFYIRGGFCLMIYACWYSYFNFYIHTSYSVSVQMLKSYRDLVRQSSVCLLIV